MWGPSPAAALLVLVLVAAGCGDASDDDGSADGPGTATTAPDGSASALQRWRASTARPIRVGVITDPTGSAGAIADPTTAGSRAYFDALNAAGGVADRYEVELVEADGDPAATTADAAYQAIRDDVVLIAQILGTDTVAGLLPRLVEDGLVASPASLDAVLGARAAAPPGWRAVPGPGRQRPDLVRRGR